MLQLLQKIQIFRKIHHMSVLSLQQHAGGDLTGVHGIEAVLDLLTERLYLVTGWGGSGSVERSAAVSWRTRPCMPAGCPENWI